MWRGVLHVVTGSPGNGTTPPTTQVLSSCFRPAAGHEQKSAVGGAVPTRIRTTNGRFTVHTHTPIATGNHGNGGVTPSAYLIYATAPRPRRCSGVTTVGVKLLGFHFWTVAVTTAPR